MALGRKAAFVDLSSGRTEVKEIPRALRESFLGGRGIGMRFLDSLLEPGLDPWAPGNRLILSAGLLAGTPAPLAAGAIHICGKLPLTGLAGNLLLGGFFGAEMRFAGFDHLVIRGRADRSVCLGLYNGQIEIQDAAPFRDTGALQARDVIRDILGEENAQVLSTGAPGDDPSLPVEMRTDAGNGRESSELGLLMKSKNLKAVAVRGTLPIEIEDPDGALRYLGELTDLCPSGHAVVSSNRDRVRAIYEDECLQALTDSLGIDRSSGEFLSLETPYWKVCSLLVAAVTGLRFSPSELMRSGERIVNLERLFNIREGFTEARMNRFMQGVDREHSGISPLTEAEWALYCELHGWDEQGRPIPETLKSLGLNGQRDTFILG